MNFIQVKESCEIYKDNQFITVESDICINVDNISLIRESSSGLSIFLVGHDKAIKITNKEDINFILKTCHLKHKLLKE